MNRSYILVFALSLIFLSGCIRNPLDVSTDGVEVKINYVNLDSVFVNFSENQLLKIPETLGIYESEILAYELGQCLRVGPLSDSGTVGRIKLFVNDKFISQVEKRIAERFRDLSESKMKITEGFRYLKYHFPKGKQPQNILFMNSGFASSVFCTEREIGVSLERYLGAATDVIKELPIEPFHQWIKDKMDAQYLERDVLTAWIMTHYFPELKGNLAEQMVHWGKILYLTEAAFPKVEEHLILRYSRADLEWANKNEYAFWDYIVKQKLLFTENERDQANFLNEAPFTIGLPEKGPDRLGQFCGWKMVKSYMRENPNTKLSDLINIPYNEILQSYEID